MKSNRIASIIIESNRIVRSVNRSGPSLIWIIQSVCFNKVCTECEIAVCKTCNLP